MCVCVCVQVSHFLAPHNGASLSEPHTSKLALSRYMCCLYVLVQLLFFIICHTRNET